MKERLKFSCWHCERIFSLSLEIDEKGDLLSECPYCSEEVLIELEPYRDKIISVFRDDTGRSKQITSKGKFDEIIPTRKPETDKPAE